LIDKKPKPEKKLDKQDLYMDGENNFFFIYNHIIALMFL